MHLFYHSILWGEPRKEKGQAVSTHEKDAFSRDGVSLVIFREYFAKSLVPQNKSLRYSSFEIRPALFLLPP